MAKIHVKKGDSVKIICGADKGNTGKVLSVDLKKRKVVVEGVNSRKRAVKRSQANPSGGLVEMECPIDISNVAPADKVSKKKDAGTDNDASVK